ncbi:MAG: FeoA domain-containing protein [Firmicutes bacterium]|nr:FeoA domain-containing protein [Bacillota bacterium]
MQDIVTLQELPLGQMGEIVSLSEEHQKAIYQELGAGVGMTVMVLQKAVNWLVQIGYSQVDVGSKYLQHIKVKPIGV